MLSEKFGNKIKNQFRRRAETFEDSANWVNSMTLLHAHKQLISNHNKSVNTAVTATAKSVALELCCGTGLVGAAIKNQVKTVIGLDTSPAMLAQAKHRLTRVIKGNAEQLHFPDKTFNLIICRQSLHFLNLKKLALAIKRVLRPGGQIIISQTVPFGRKDRAYLYKIHSAKQPLLKNFVTEADVARLVKSIGCKQIKKRTVYIKESITDWMKHSPELPLATRKKVLELYRQAPADYRKLHRLKITNNKITEYWKWVVVSGLKNANTD